jgi:hypothetical protein
MSAVGSQAGLGAPWPWIVSVNTRDDAHQNMPGQVVLGMSSPPSL